MAKETAKEKASFRLAPQSTCLRGYSGFDNIHGTNIFPREILWIVLQYLDFADTVNLISSGMVPWTDLFKTRTSVLNRSQDLLPFFPPFPADRSVETINEDGDLEASSIAEVQDETLILNPCFLQYQIATLVFGDPLYCKFCKKSATSSTINIYWVWLVRCCDLCVSKYTISDYDLREAKENVKEIREHLPCIKKPFMNWGSMAYDFYWAPDVIWSLKKGMFKFKTQNELMHWYEMTNKYSQWSKVERFNQTSIINYLKTLRTDSIHLQLLRTCPSFSSRYKSPDLIKSRDFTSEYGEKLCKEYDEALGITTAAPHSDS